MVQHFQIPQSPRISNKLLDDSVSEASYELPQNDLNLDAIISYHDLQLSKTLRLNDNPLSTDIFLSPVLEEQSIAGLLIPKGLSAEEELRLLRRQHFNKPSVERTVSTLLSGQQTSLEHFKSLNDKELLLDLAIDSGNGDAILYVVLFLEETLNQTLFAQMMRIRMSAVNHYKNYLCARGHIQKCSDFLTMLGLQNEAAV